MNIFEYIFAGIACLGCFFLVCIMSSVLFYIIAEWRLELKEKAKRLEEKNV